MLEILSQPLELASHATLMLLMFESAEPSFPACSRRCVCEHEVKLTVRSLLSVPVVDVVFS